MNYLTGSQVLFLHARLIAETGGTPGILSASLLAAAVARPQATYGGKDLYTTLFLKAAALMDSLVRNHPFMDGNKRVGITAAGLFLRLNGYRLVASNAELEQFTLRVTQSQMTIAQMANWFEYESQRLP